MAEIITDIERKGAYYALQMADGAVFRVPGPLLRQFPLRVGMAFDPEAYQCAHGKEAFRFACERAAFFLEKKDYPAALLREKLTEGGYIGGICDAVLALLTERGYVDDRRYADNLIQRRAKKIGPYRIRQELLQKKIDRTIIDEAMCDGAAGQDDQLPVARQYVSKYMATRRGQDIRKLRANATAMLARKGFGFDVARKACDAYFDEE